MISFLRGKLQGIVAFSFLVIVSLTFAFLGLPTFTQSFSSNDYAELGDYKISQSEYFRVKGEVEQNLRTQYGQNIDLLDPSIVEVVQNLTNNSLIEKYTLINLLDDLGVVVPDNYVENELAKSEAFMENEKFSQERFKNYLVNFGLTKKDLVEDSKSAIQFNISVGFLNSTSNSFEKSLISYLELISEERTIKFTEITADNVLTDYVPTDEEVELFYKENINNFTIPEKRSFYLATANIDNFSIDVTDEELKNAYELYLTTLPNPEKRISHLMIIQENYEDLSSFNNKVSEIEDILNADDFEDLVIQYSEDPGTSNGDLGYTDGSVFPPEFETVIAGLGVGDISGAINFEGNIHFLKVTEISGAENESFDVKKSDLERELKLIAFENDVLEIGNSLVDQSFNKDDVAEFAESFSLDLESYEAVSISQANFIISNSEKIFSLEKDSWSEGITINSGEVVYAYVFDIEPENFEDLESVKTPIIERLVALNKQSYLDTVYANEDEFILDKDSIEGIYSVENVKVDEYKNITRSTSLLKPELINIMFNEYQTGTVIKELTTEGILFYEIISRSKGDSSIISDEAKEQIRLELEIDILQRTFNSLRELYDLDNKLFVDTQFINLNS